jgi:hypothetical protein
MWMRMRTMARTIAMMTMTQTQLAEAAAGLARIAQP